MYRSKSKFLDDSNTCEEKSCGEICSENSSAGFGKCNSKKECQTDDTKDLGCGNVFILDSCSS